MTYKQNKSPEKKIAKNQKSLSAKLIDELPQPFWQRHSDVFITIVAMVLCAGLAFHGLGNHAFWTDEANTAIFARNLLNSGTLTGWDGQNLVGFMFGAELDENLVNIYIPPAQYYVAAASLAIFGQSTIGGRILFVIFGLATLPWLTLFARRLGNGLFPAWLPAILLALSPAWLLYIRNCRYYSVGAFFSLMLLACFVAPLYTRRQQLVAAVLAAVATTGLIATHYTNAAFIITALPLLLLLKHLRCRSRVILLLLIGLIAAAIGIIVLIYANPLGSKFTEQDNTPHALRLAKLLWYHLRDMALFEHVPVLLALVLPLPFLIKRLEPQKPLVAIGIVLIAIFGLSAVITALVSPQSVQLCHEAFMRHMVPLIPLGSLFAALTLFILWQLAQLIALTVAILLVFSNLLFLGNLDKNRGLGLAPRGVSSTLVDYISETFNDYKTNTETIIRILKDKPEGSVILVIPTYMMYTPMFYLPKLHYTCQIDAQKGIRPDLAAMLPPYVFGEKAKLDYALIIRNEGIPDSGNLNLYDQKRNFKFDTYTKEDMIKIYPFDCSRPEIGWHAFSVEEYRDDYKQHLFVLNFRSSVIH